MSSRYLVPLWMLLALLAGCGRSDPLTALEAAVQQLQSTIEDKDNGAVLDQLHPQFAAQQQTLDRDWARRSMALLFLRHKNIQVIALSHSSRLDAISPEKGYTQAQLALTGAEALIPDSARHYSVTLEWWLDEGQWKLARLDWE
ncbi:MAG: hypothetical protein V4812_02075 [Pseudomonadota bacterium]